ncbi:LexA family protein [Raoultella ornithinolytica]|uniref:LexA family protein n=1 Tax=Raoultella ornithinolytica TaxID=54291 RepID=UPI000EEE582B|nr:hypothetical protein [Raoultella ornithinolytica]EHC3600434.1 hypothetical protein [Salmonella enterica subsp. enterica serovar Enteritidis]MCF6709472.1 hypothetical protein [Raoultella ornithinolytica]HAT1663495.1 hypothetical protein [Raoultella ornithinolytica]HAT1666244.1 hypothetical protein [Raoultella ornithinolytica]HCJ06131.1 hypothetical protein [Raoultella ornithinolytica]
MGFPSPATDYIERRISITSLCSLGANTLVVETSDGYAVVDVSRRPRQGDTVLVRYDGRAEFTKLMGRALITADGEAIEGDALDDVEVIGVVTHTIIDVQRDDSPV